MIADATDRDRIVITGVGLTAPNGNNLAEFRDSLLAGRSGVTRLRNPLRRRDRGRRVPLRRAALPEDARTSAAAPAPAASASTAPTRPSPTPGSTGPTSTRSTVGIYVGVTEHGNVETENEIYELKGFDYDTQVLVAPPQPAHRGQQPGRRNLAEPGHHRPALHDRRRLCRRQRGHHPGRADAAAGRVRRGPGRRRVGEHSHVRHLRQLQEPGALARHADPSGPAGRSTSSATASSWPKGAACTCSSGWPTPGAAARRSTAKWPATP